MTPQRLISLIAVVFCFAAFAGGAVAEDPAVKVAGAEAEKPKAEKPKAKKKSSAKGKKKAAVAESRYTSRELSESSEHSYRFDARGNPLGGKKKEAEKAKKTPSAPPEEKPEDKAGACTLEAPCPEKGSDADAL
ncbi:MAG: hypothetical protein AAB262_08610 [Elusimicrobiota bacterium]